jgi:hypothetical protein
MRAQVFFVVGQYSPKNGGTPPTRLIDSGCRISRAIDYATLGAEPMWSPQNKLGGTILHGDLPDL